MRVEHIGDCTLYLADCADVLPTLSGIDAVVTDPPYGLSFMGKKWDYQVPGVAIWELCLAAMKPGAHLLSFAGTRTQHRMAVNIEDAGFEIRDMIAWVYGSGFPKSHNLKGEWAGWGTALKPALEPITVARKPLNGTVAANVLEHGTGGINVDGCRVATNGESLRGGASDGSSANKCHEGWDRPWKNDPKARLTAKIRSNANQDRAEKLGRWPANLIHDGSDEVVGLLDDAARFFYCAKASKRDRADGLDGFPLFDASNDDNAFSANPGRARTPQAAIGGARKRIERGLPPVEPRANNHPTVKPTDLMRYLCRLVTQPSGVVLDPFMGSGSTGKAAVKEGFRFIGIERDEEYFDIACRRIEAAMKKGRRVEPRRRQYSMFDEMVSPSLDRNAYGAPSSACGRFHGVSTDASS